MLAPLLRDLAAAEVPILDEHGLTMWGYSVLVALDRGPMRSQAALAESINADKTRIIPTLDELQAQGFRVRVHTLSTSGVVRFQRPGPNAERPPGSEVHLWH